MWEIGALKAEGKLGAPLDLGEQGEEVVITRGGRAVARLVPSAPVKDREAVRAAARRMLERSQRTTWGLA